MAKIPITATARMGKLVAEELDLGKGGLVKVVDRGGGGGGIARLLKGLRRSVRSIDSKRSMKRRNLRKKMLKKCKIYPGRTVGIILIK